MKGVAAPLRLAPVRGHAEGSEELRAPRVAELGGQHPDHLVTLPVELDPLAERRRLPAEELLPERVRQHRHGVLAVGRILATVELPPVRAHAEEGEELAHRLHPRDPRRLARAGEAQVHAPVRGERLEEVAPRRELLRVERRDRRFTEIEPGHVQTQRHHPVQLGGRERAQQYAVDGAEDRRVRADPEREREHRDQGEAGALPQRAERVAQVLEKRIHVMCPHL
jgi:hypothetical protein